MRVRGPELLCGMFDVTPPCGWLRHGVRKGVKGGEGDCGSCTPVGTCNPRDTKTNTEHQTMQCCKQSPHVTHCNQHHGRGTDLSQVGSEPLSSRATVPAPPDDGSEPGPVPAAKVGATCASSTAPRRICSPCPCQRMPPSWGSQSLQGSTDQPHNTLKCCDNGTGPGVRRGVPPSPR